MNTPRAVILILLVCGINIANAEQTVRIAIGEWQPYLSEHAPHYGFATHIVTESFSLQGIDVEYGFFPWKRSYMLSKQGQPWIGTGVWLHSEDRAEFFYYSDPVVPTNVAFFHLKDVGFDWSAIEDLSDLKIGVTLGYSYGPDFDTAVKKGNITTEESRTDELNLQKILKGRIDVFPGEVMVIHSLIREKFSPEIAAQFTHHSKSLHENSQHLLLSKSNPESQQLVEIFNDGLKQLKKSGRYDKIIADGLTGKYASQK